MPCRPKGVKRKHRGSPKESAAGQTSSPRRCPRKLRRCPAWRAVGAAASFRLRESLMKRLFALGGRPRLRSGCRRRTRRQKPGAPARLPDRGWRATTAALIAGRTARQPAPARTRTEEERSSWGQPRTAIFMTNKTGRPRRKPGCAPRAKRRAAGLVEGGPSTNHVNSAPLGVVLIRRPAGGNVVHFRTAGPVAGAPRELPLALLLLPPPWSRAHARTGVGTPARSYAASASAAAAAFALFSLLWRVRSGGRCRLPRENPGSRYCGSLSFSAAVAAQRGLRRSLRATRRR